MATSRSDVAKSMYIDAKEVFMQNLKKYSDQQWKKYMVEKSSEKDEEKYETIGNLKPASEKAEGAPIQYGRITDGNTTIIRNKTYANGVEFTMEMKEDNKWGIVKAGSVPELARTMMTLRETESAAIWDATTTATGADGVAYASNSHPLLNNPALVNDNLVTGVLSFASWKEGVDLFNEWKNHYGEKFETMANKALAHRNQQTTISALLGSQLKAFESSNTKNTIEMLEMIYSTYIDKTKIHMLDTSIDSAVFQRRKGLVNEYDYDKRSTFNVYFNVHERYKTGMINPGFGFVTLTGA